MIPIRDNLRCRTFPIVTLLLIVLNCFAFFGQLIISTGGDTETFVRTYAMTPGKVVHAFGSGSPELIGMAIVSMFTAMFLHGSWAHLIGNMIYLNCFGRAMEARLGWARYLGFYLLAGLVADLAHIASAPYSMVPTLGASGAIAGVLGGYLLLWPLAEVFGIAFVGLPLPVTVRAYWYLIFWLGIQIISLLPTIGKVTAGGGVAYWAHIGGFVAGLGLAFLYRRFFNPVSDVCYIERDCDCEGDEDGDDNWRR